MEELCWQMVYFSLLLMSRLYSVGKIQGADSCEESWRIS